MHIKALISILGLVSQWLPAPSPLSHKETPVHYPSASIVREIPPVQLAPLAHLPMADYPVAPAGTYLNTYAPGNCTWYVASMKGVPNSWGNANTWASRAAADGYTVSPVPVVGSIAASTRGWAGHVAVVRAISGGQVLIDEMNSQGLGVIDQRWEAVGNYQYIYK